MMSWKRAVGVMVCLCGMLVGAGCEDPNQLRADNQHLRTEVFRLNEEAFRLRSEVEALRNQPAPRVDDSQIRAMQVELDTKERQIAALRNAINAYRRETILNERVEARLRALAAELDGEYLGNRLRLPGDYFFGSGQWDLMPQGKEALRRFAEIMNEEDLTIMIVGHTDNVPINRLRQRGVHTNRHLSLLRSHSVLQELEKFGYDSNLMYPTGWGELRPVASNATNEGRQANRRVEIYIDPAASGLLSVSAITDVEPAGGGFRPAPDMGRYEGPILIED